MVFRAWQAAAHGFQLIRASSDEGDASTLARKFDGDGAADAAARSRYQSETTFDL